VRSGTISPYHHIIIAVTVDITGACHRATALITRGNAIDSKAVPAVKT
jgi:hypothetical protein